MLDISLRAVKISLFTDGFLAVIGQALKLIVICLNGEKKRETVIEERGE